MSLREAFLALFGIAAAAPSRPSLHDDRVHDAANRETVAMAQLRLGERAGDRILGPMIAAQKADPQGDDLRRGAEVLRSTIEHHGKKLDAFDRVFKPKDHR